MYGFLWVGPMVTHIPSCRVMGLNPNNCSVPLDNGQLRHCCYGDLIIKFSISAFRKFDSQVVVTTGTKSVTSSSKQLQSFFFIPSPWGDYQELMMTFSKLSAFLVFCCSVLFHLLCNFNGFVSFFSLDFLYHTFWCLLLILNSRRLGHAAAVHVSLAPFDS